jgi:hypothetical protein
MAALFAQHPLALQTMYSELKRRALEPRTLLLGSPGSVVVRTNGGRRFLYRDYYGPEGKKAADYVGPEEDAAARARAAELRESIATANALIAEARLLVQSGYVRTDARTDAVLVALARNALFDAGAVLVGSHAYGTLLNELGIRAAAYKTEDVDVARDRPLRVEHPPKVFAAILEESKVALQPVPQLDRKKASTSFKLRGPDRFRVDLLTPTDGTEVTVLPIRELDAHATGLPWLRYVLHDPIPAVVIGWSAMVPVKVPDPTRLAWHKMLVSDLRHETNEKREKDIEQAATLVAALAASDPEGLTRAQAAIPRTAKRHAHRGARRVLVRLEKTSHVEAAALMKELVG